MTHLRRCGLALATIALISTAYVTDLRPAHAQTQLEMNEQSRKDFDQADRQLNVVYKQLLSKFDAKDQDELKTRKKIIAAEKTWIAYRDAQGEMDASVTAEGGSMYPQILYGTMATLTEERVKRLKDQIKDMNSR